LTRRSAGKQGSPPAAGEIGSGARELPVFVHELVRRLYIIGVHRNAIDGTHFAALRRIKVADAFGAFVRVDDIDVLTLGDCAIRALGFANITVDAFVGDHQSHFLFLVTKK
jgi:hypothetical protein